MSKRRPPPDRPEGGASLNLSDREAELWVAEQVRDEGPPSLILAEREAATRHVREVTLTSLEANLRVQEGQVRVESGKLDIALRKRVAYWLIALFSVNTASALTMIFLIGFGLMTLSEKVIMSVLGATVIEAAAMLFTITKYLFPARNQKSE